ncbi:ROK family transcriptional regulator [Pseudonocardia endophytica]|uniref:Putative NBD/HSP70 family sugar kinase n=1 Tax=Pseudonocardia endophytica TaxID=401976 RepID=A0A4R1HSR1_PSEEN|nr:ROK family transcriptional regulator [Pseudonocardia endophytica]TCK22899.1 putative NBD/HSP70 family sugar kinase [Pseudonocardia endophytica]
MTSAPEETPRDGWARLDGSLRAVAVEVLRHGPLPRAELARRLGLSPGSLTRLTRPLLEDGLLVEGGPELQSRTGRPSVPLDVRATRARFVGVTVTADEAIAVVTDLRSRLLDHVMVPLPGRSPDDVVECVAGIVRRFAPVEGLGVGIGGLVAEHRDVVVAPFLGWDEPVALARLLAGATGVPSSVDNDVRALAAAEHWFGAGRGLHSFALVTIGSEVGAALVVHDDQVCGARGLGGAVGHLPLVPADHPAAAGGPCELGHRGCAQAVLSTSGMAAAARARFGRPVSTDELWEIQPVLDAAAEALAVLVGGVVGLADPEVVLVSGTGAGLVDAARPALETGLGAGRRPQAPAVPVRVAPFARTDWARGAAVVAVQDHVRGTPGGTHR